MSKAKIRGRHRDINRLRKLKLVRITLDLDDETLALLKREIKTSGKSKDEVLADILRNIINNCKNN